MLKIIIGVCQNRNSSAETNNEDQQFGIMLVFKSKHNPNSLDGSNDYLLLECLFSENLIG